MRLFTPSAPWYKTAVHAIIVFEWICVKMYRCSHQSLADRGILLVLLWLTAVFIGARSSRWSGLSVSLSLSLSKARVWLLMAMGVSSVWDPLSFQCWPFSLTFLFVVCYWQNRNSRQSVDQMSHTLFGRSPTYRCSDYKQTICWNSVNYNLWLRLKLEVGFG